MLTSLYVFLDSLPSFQNDNNNAELKSFSLEPFTTTDETIRSDNNTPETLVDEKTVSDASDFDDTSAPSDMYQAKSQAAGSGTNQGAASKPRLKAAASGAKSPSSAAGSRANSVTVKAKGSRESSKVGTGDIPPKNEKTVSPGLLKRDQSSHGPLIATSSKSKIPKRSTSDADVKSPVTPDKPSLTDSSSKLQKQPRTKESLVSVTKGGRKPSFEETKGVRSLSGDISPTKSTYKTKLLKEKFENMESANLVNGIEKVQNEYSAKTGKPLDVKKQPQIHLENTALLASKTRLPISSPTRKKKDDKTSVTGQIDSDRPKDSPEQDEVPPAEISGSEIPSPPPLPDSPRKGK